MTAKTVAQPRKSVQVISRDVHPGIYDGTAVARIYPDRTVATVPGVRWVGNTGSYHEYKYRITGAEHQEILDAMSDGCEDEAWAVISRHQCYAR